MVDRTCPWASCLQRHACETPACGPACSNHFCAEVMV